MTLPKPKAVIFDWDDTIVDSWYTALEALNTALVAMGHTAWTDMEARQRAGQSARDLFQKLFGDEWQKADKIYYDTFTKVFANNMRVHDNVEDVLKALSEQGVYLAVVSNKRGTLLRAEAEHTGFDKYFGKIVGAGDAEADKPHPAPVHMALEGSGIAAGPDVWFIGDSPTDMLCALNALCTPVLIETKLPPEEMLKKHPPAKRFKKHNDIMEFIKGEFV